MKRVSFKVAKALKETGYPQDKNNGTAIYPTEGEFEGILCSYNIFAEERDIHSIVAPYVMEVWLWLWREKHIAVEADYSCANDDWFYGGICGKKFTDPEEAISEAIEYLVEQNLIK